MNPKSEVAKIKVALYLGSNSYLKLAYSAGTKHPHIAMTARSPICRKYVLLPDEI